MNEEEVLFEKEGRGRFNLRQSAEVHFIPYFKRSKTGPSRIITNRPQRDLVMPTRERARYVPRIVKNETGDDLRMMVRVTC